MPIVLAPHNVDLTIMRVGTDQKTKKHLQSLGVMPNSVIKIIASAYGNVIIEVKGVRLAMNKEVATKIFVA
ncbi:MAG: ferrous iron transport protein A [Erysipelotrichaceae bacterium]|nr:ferrous iron transport protein A [Erysipelotrichaceae bacterium]